MAARWRRRNSLPVDWAGELARPGPSGTGLRVTCRTDWSFLAPYQRRKAESSGNVAVADAGDGAGCAGVEDGVSGRKRRSGFWRQKSEAGEEEGREEPVAHGPVPTCTPVSLGPCGDWIGVFTYIESLPTYNYRLPILPRSRARLPTRSASLYAKFTRFA